MNFLKLVPAQLVLQNGMTYQGHAPEWFKETAFGEIVFTTGMTGYVESLTDPSYAGQILSFTFPLIGNYGVPAPSFWESSKIHVKGVIMNQICPFYSHHQAKISLSKWLHTQKVPFLSGIDTRALTKKIRTEGCMLGAITQKDQTIVSFVNPYTTCLVKEVSCLGLKKYGKGKKNIILVDCGMKQNILRCLLNFPVQIKRVPFDYDYLDQEYDGILLSNGPGDPLNCRQTVEILKKALTKKKPIFGICLGAQLMALASQAKTYKLPFGHRGQNQPCECMESGRFFLTSQNHGFAIEENSLPKNWKVTFRNVNDGSIEGIQHTNLPYFAVQFHPEASPGPNDMMRLFETFYRML